MSVNAVISQLSDANHGLILTFIVPNHSGCNLKCSFCYISQRREHFENIDIDTNFYRKFICEVLEKEKVSAVCIQGHEPLLPESAQFTFSILEEAYRHRLSTGLVTNGTHLANSIQYLCKWPPNKLAVSLDAAIPELHDRQRGVPGAWEATTNGIQSAVRDLDQRSELVVTSVLIPKRRKQLEDMPTLLNELGIKRWVVNPLLKVGKTSAGNAIGDRQQIWQDLLFLKRIADQHFVDFAVDDECNILSIDADDRNVVDINALRINRLPKPTDLFRLLPTGQCSSGMDILKQVSDDAPVWVPNQEHAGSFIQRMRAA